MGSKCILCGQKSIQIHNVKKDTGIYWKEYWSTCLSQILACQSKANDDETLRDIISQSDYCEDCIQTADKIGFAHRQISLLKTQIRVKKTILLERLQENYSRCHLLKLSNTNGSATELGYCKSVMKLFHGTKGEDNSEEADTTNRHDSHEPMPRPLKRKRSTNGVRPSSPTCEDVISDSGSGLNETWSHQTNDRQQNDSQKIKGTRREENAEETDITNLHDSDEPGPLKRKRTTNGVRPSSPACEVVISDSGSNLNETWSHQTNDRQQNESQKIEDKSDLAMFPDNNDNEDFYEEYEPVDPSTTGSQSPIPASDSEDKEESDDEKIYGCSILNCQETFIDISKMDEHIAITHYGCPSPYKCPKCVKNFNTERQFRHHYVNRHEQKLPAKVKIRTIMYEPGKSYVRFRCIMEGCTVNSKRPFRLLTFLKIHLKNDHNLEYNSEQEFLSVKDTAWTEERAIIPKQKFPCPIDSCKSRFAFKKGLQTHIKNFHVADEDKLFSCNICNKKFGSSTSRDYHLTRHSKLGTVSNDGNVVCKLCNKTFRSSTTRLVHEKKRMCTTTCSLCGLRLESVELLNAHQDWHRQIEHPFSCSECNDVFYSSKDVRVHVRRNHFPRETCKTCGQTFLTGNGLKQHMNIHDDRKTLCCDICSKKFVNQKQLDIHRTSHSSDRNYLCEFCCKTYKTLAKLNFHRKLHLHVEGSSKQYKCHLCPKSYDDYSSLLAHEETHANMPNHICDVCFKSFKFINSLRTHKRKYCKKKPADSAKSSIQDATEGVKAPNHICDACFKSFKFKNSLKTHKRKYCKKKPADSAKSSIQDATEGVKAPNHICDFCFKSFKFKNSLRTHQRKYCKKQQADSAKSSIQDATEVVKAP